MPWIDPFLASLRPHRLPAALIALQAATTAIVLVVAVARFGQLQERASRPSGVDEQRLAQVLVNGRADPSGQLREQQALAALPGVAAVARVNQLPFGARGWASSVSAQPRLAGGAVDTAVYFGDPGLRAVLGLQLREGRDFLPQEQPAAPQSGNGYGDAAHAQISAGLADQLFPGASALGRHVYVGTQRLRVVGIYDRLQGRDPAQAQSMILPLRARDVAGATYVLRVRGAMPERGALEAAVAAADAGRWLDDARSLSQLRDAWYRSLRTAQAAIVAGLVLWLLGTAVGMANLADLLLQYRSRQIGIRRALGARAAQIRWQLRAENLLLVGGGAAAGLLSLAALWRLWPWLAASLPAPEPASCVLAWVLMTVTGQFALWPVTHQADAISPALSIRLR